MPLPFRNKLLQLTQPDGTSVEVRGWGDQHMAHFETTAEGYAVVRHHDRGYVEIACRSADGTLVPSGLRADTLDAIEPQARGITPVIRGQAGTVFAASTRGLPQVITGWKRRWAQKKAARATAAGGLSAAALVTPPPPVGSVRGLCIVVDFPPEQSPASRPATAPLSVPLSEVESFLNQRGYRGNGNNGSVHDYFLDVSRGKLDYSCKVVGYTAKQPKTHYTDRSVEFPQRAQELLAEALTKLKDDGFDFSGITAVGGELRALSLLYQGAEDKAYNQGLYPHSFSLTSAVEVARNLSAHDYMLAAAGDSLELGTFCHETGHMVCDFPDLYDTDDPAQHPALVASYGVGDYCLMGTGPLADPKNPPQVCAFLKLMAQWQDSLTELPVGKALTLSAARNELFYHSLSQTEYFLFENRFSAGRDSALKSSGLAIWHVDEAVRTGNTNEQMTSQDHYECALIQADGNADLERNNNSGDATDLFNASVKTSLDDTTTPNSHWWDGTPSGLKVTGVGTAGPAIHFST
jgi:M6 family metalloprotease-like protein